MNNEQSPKKIIAVYLRVSTERQEQERTIENQMMTIEEYAKDNNYHIVKKYIDNGWSGDRLDRPALDQMRQDVKLKLWDAVLIYDPDRLARRYSYQELIMDELKEAGIEVMFITTTTPQNSEEKILHGVRGLFAEYERAKISERFRLGKLRKVKEGHILLSKPPYGYDYVPKKDGKHGYLVINENEARVVRMIFEWVAYDGLTQRKIVSRLKELKIKPRSSKREVWTTSTLCTLLRNKVYIGEAHWGSSYAVIPEKPRNHEKYKRLKKSSRKMKPESEWHIIPTPVIIDKKLFEKARIQLDANYKLCKRHKKNDYLLAGKIFCSCGRSRTGEGPQKGKYIYYRCSGRISDFPLPPTCKQKGINARIADYLVWNKLTELMSSPISLQNYLKEFTSNLDNRPQKVATDVDVIKNEIAKLKKISDRYTTAYGASMFSMDQLKEYLTPIKSQITALENQMFSMTNKINNINESDIPTEEEIKESTIGAKEVLKDLNFNVKRAIVIKVVEKIIGTQEILHVTGHLPIPVNMALNQYVEYCTKHRHCRSAKRRQVDIV